MFSKLTESRPCSQQRISSRPSSTNASKSSSRPPSKGLLENVRSAQVVTLPQIKARSRSSGLHQQRQSNGEGSRFLDVLFHSNSTPILSRTRTRTSGFSMDEPPPPKPAAKASLFTEANAVAILVKCLSEIKADRLQPTNDLISYRLSTMGWKPEEIGELMNTGMKNARAAERLQLNTVLGNHQRNVYRHGEVKVTPWTKPVAHPRELRDILRRNLQTLPMATVTSGKHGCKVLMHLDYPSAVAVVQKLQKNLVGQPAKAVREGRFVHVHAENLTTQQEVDELTKTLRGVM